MAHRDIKPENFKLKGKDKDLVLYDFGCSQCFDDGEDDLVTKTAGTYYFFAPEIFIHKEDSPKIMHGKRCDVWAAGITLFRIAAQSHPFTYSKGMPALIYSVVHDEVDYSVFGA